MMITVKKYAPWPLLLLPSLLPANDGAYRGESYARLTLHPGATAAMILTAEHAPWEQVFNEIAKTTGAHIHYPALPSGPVTASCAGTTVKQVMECLLAPEADFIFRYPDGAQPTASPNMPAEIWVLQSSFGMQQPSSGKNNSTICTAAAQDAAALCKQANTTAESGPNAAERTARLLESVNTADAVQRADAIAGLAIEGRPDDAAVHEALSAALSDENPEVRAQAVFGLAQREGAAAASALQQALQDSDASVRLMAVDNAGDNAALLQHALGDQDASVRELAAMRLEALSKGSAVQ